MADDDDDDDDLILSFYRRCSFNGRTHIPQVASEPKKKNSFSSFQTLLSLTNAEPIGIMNGA